MNFNIKFKNPLLSATIALLLIVILSHCNNSQKKNDSIKNELKNQLHSYNDKSNSNKNPDSVFSICNQIYFDPYFKDSTAIRIIAFNTAAELLEYMGNYDSIKGMIRKVEDTFTNSTPIELKIDLFRYNGSILNSLGHEEEALYYLKKNIKEWNSIKDKETVALISSELGRAYNGIQKYDSAIYYYQLALVHYDTSSQLLNQAIILNNISNSFADQGLFKPSVKYLNKSIKISEEIKDTLILSSNYNNLGLLYKESGLLDSALYYINKSYRLEPDSLMNISKIMTQNNLGNIYKSLNRWKESEESFLIVSEFCKLNNITPGILRSNIGLGSIAYANQDYIKAENLFISTYNLAKEVKNTSFQKKSLKCLLQKGIHAANFDFVLAYQSLMD